MLSSRRKTARSENRASSGVTTARRARSEPVRAGQPHRVNADFRATVTVFAGEQPALPDVARRWNVVLIAEVDPEPVPAISGARADRVLHDHAGERRERLVGDGTLAIGVAEPQREAVEDGVLHADPVHEAIVPFEPRLLLDR